MNFAHTKDIITLKNKIYHLLIMVFLFQFILLSSVFSEEKIGLIIGINGNVYLKNLNGDKRSLILYDEIFLGDVVFTEVQSSVTIQYKDNSTVILKQNSSFQVDVFSVSGPKNIFLGIIKRGAAIIESGSIAKKNNGKMEIKLPSTSLGIRGTRLNINTQENGISEIVLSEDSFGIVGQIDVSTGNELKTIFNTDEAVSIDRENNVTNRAVTETELNEANNVSETLIQASKIDENIIQKNLESQLVKGNLRDANNDGIINIADVEAIKESIKIDKKDKINFITENSNRDNINFLSNVLNASDDISIGESLNEILLTNDDLISNIVSDLSDAGNSFITKSENENNNAVKEKIYNKILSDTENEEFNLSIISKIITQSDTKTVAQIIDNVQSYDGELESNKSLKVLSNVATIQNKDSINFEIEKQTEVNRLILEAINQAQDSNEDSALLANVITKSDILVMEFIIDNIQETDEQDLNSNISLQILSSVATLQSSESINLENEEQTQINRLIQKAVERSEDNIDDSILLANIITKSDVSVIEEIINFIQEVEEDDEETNISLQVLSSVATLQSSESINLENEEQTQINRLIQKAVERSEDNIDDSILLANIITKSDVSVIEEIINFIQEVEEDDEETNISLQVLSSVVQQQSDESIQLDTDEQSQVNRLIKEALERANEEEDDVLLENIIKNDENIIEEIIDAIEEEAEEEQEAQEEAEQEEAEAEQEEAEEEAEQEEAEEEQEQEEAEEEQEEAEEEAEEYDANGFSLTTPFLHRDTGTEYNSEGFNSDGYNDQGFNENGDYNEVYDTNVSEN